MGFAILSSIFSAMSGAMNYANIMKSQSMSEITSSGKGTGFYRFYSNTAVGESALSAKRCGSYIADTCNYIMKEAAPELQQYTNEIIESLQEIAYFESYNWGECDSLINTVHYNKFLGNLYFNIYVFSPFMHPKRGEGVKVQKMKIMTRFELAKDWVIVNKVKANFFKASMKQEIQYLPDKGIKMDDIIEAMAIALSPAVLGIVKLPDRFMKVLGIVVDEQRKDPDERITTAPTTGKAEEAFNDFCEMQKKQEDYIKNQLEGFVGLGDAVKGLGEKGQDLPPPQ